MRNNTADRALPSPSRGIGSLVSLAVGAIAIALTGCNNITTDRYEATALTTFSWQVEYSNSPVSSKSTRFETFGSSSLENTNGQKPDAAVVGPDDKGLWWPALPPRPSLEEVEQRLQPNEKPGTPELIKSVKYQLTYQVGSKSETLPTNYYVYRQVAKAFPTRTPLRFILGVNDASVEKAEPL